MKVCDKCIEIERATQEVHLTYEDAWFDLCEKHMDELMKFLKTKDKKKRGILSKRAA